VALGQAVVNQPYEGAAFGRLDRDSQGVRAGLGRPLEGEAEHDLPTGIDLEDSAGRDGHGRQGPPELSAGAQVDSGGYGEPASQAVGLRDQREGLVGGHGQQCSLLDPHE